QGNRGAGRSAGGLSPTWSRETPELDLGESHKIYGIPPIFRGSSERPANRLRRRAGAVRVHGRTRRDQICWRLVSEQKRCTSFEQQGCAVAENLRHLGGTCWRTSCFSTWPGGPCVGR